MWWGIGGIGLFMLVCVVGMIAEGNPYDAGPDPIHPKNWL